jgi:hypothetical protein
MVRAMRWGGTYADVDRLAHVKPLTLRRRIGRGWTSLSEVDNVALSDLFVLLGGVIPAMGRLLRVTLTTVLPWVAYDGYRIERAQMLERRERLILTVRRLGLAEGHDVRNWIMAIDDHLDQAARGRRIGLLLRYALFVLGSILPVAALAGWTPVEVGIGIVIAFTVALQNYRWNGQWRWHLLSARQYEVELRRFLTLRGPYQGRTYAQAYPLFARRMQAMDERFSTLIYEVENWLLPPG